VNLRDKQINENGESKLTAQRRRSPASEKVELAIVGVAVELDRTEVQLLAHKAARMVASADSGVAAAAGGAKHSPCRVTSPGDIGAAVISHY
jgi:hypothetical protein